MLVIKIGVFISRFRGSKGGGTMRWVCTIPPSTPLAYMAGLLYPLVL